MIIISNGVGGFGFGPGVIKISGKVYSGNKSDSHGQGAAHC